MRLIQLSICFLVCGLLASEQSNVFEHLRGKKNVVSALVIGSGPAGCMAAMQAARLGLDVVMCDGPQPGGQLTQTGDVENWPGIVRARGADIMAAQRTQVEQHGVIIVSETIKTIVGTSWPFHIQTEEGTELNALTIVVATGSTPRLLGVPGEAQLWGMGVSACALCDGPLFKDKIVAVVGGGDSAIEEVLQLSAYARKIILLVRGPQLRASPAMQDKLADVEQLSVRYDTQVQAIEGDENGVHGVVLYTVQNKSTETVALDGVFLAIGHEPRIELVRNMVELTPQGYIKIIGQGQATSKPGIFAAGDVTKGMYRQAGVAAGEGQKAAEDVGAYLQALGLSAPVLKALRLGKRTIEGLQFYCK